MLDKQQHRATIVFPDATDATLASPNGSALLLPEVYRFTHTQELQTGANQQIDPARQRRTYCTAALSVPLCQMEVHPHLPDIYPCQASISGVWRDPRKKPRLGRKATWLVEVHLWREHQVVGNHVEVVPPL